MRHWLTTMPDAFGWWSGLWSDGVLPVSRGHQMRPKTHLTVVLTALVMSLPGRANAADPTTRFEPPPLSELLSPLDLPDEEYRFEPDERWAEPRDPFWGSFADWVIRQQRLQSPKIERLGEWADRTLSGSDQSLPNNESYLRLGFASESDYTNPAQFEPEARFRLDIPTTRRKLRLVIESESEEQVPLAERQRDRLLTQNDRTSTEPTGALRYLTQLGDAINFSADVGGRLRFPPDAFWRVTAGKSWLPGKDWSLAVQQRVYYYHQGGWGARSWFGASRPLGDGWRFGASSELEWVHEDRKFEAAQIFSLEKVLNTRSRVIPRLGILGESQPTWQTTNYFADLTWRYRVYSDWLYAEVIPALQFPRDEGFSDQASLLFRVEMYFAGTIEAR